MKHNLISITILLVAALILSGCASMFIQYYGYVASDADIIREDGNTISITNNIPSISQGYRPLQSRQDDRFEKGNHEGIDIISQKGTPVLAAASGVVISSFYRPLFGNRIVIDHGKDNNGMFILSRYVHLDRMLLQKGDRVVRGQQIGTMGSTGLLAGGFPHLHFEIRSGVKPEISKSEPSNPHRFWSDGVGVVTCFDINKILPERPFKTTYPVPCKGIEWKQSL